MTTKKKVDPIVSEYFSKIGKKGGGNSSRTWSEEQKTAMVKKKAATLAKKKLKTGLSAEAE